MSKNTKSAPQLAYVEEHNLHLNIAPLVQILCESYDCDPQTIAKRLDRVLRFLGENTKILEIQIAEDAIAFNESFSLLHDLKDMFTRCTIIREK